MHDQDRTTAPVTGADQAASEQDATDLRRLSDVGSDYEVADGYPDIRGWQVKTPDGQTLGTVHDLVVSVSQMRVRYLDVDVDAGVPGAGVAVAASGGTGTAHTDGHTLVPIGSVELRKDGDDVIITGLTSELGAYPRYARGQGITREYESRVRNHLGGTTAAASTAATADDDSAYYAHEQYDDQRAFASRRPETTGNSGTTRTMGDAAAAGRAGEQEVGIPSMADQATATRYDVLSRRDAARDTARAQADLRRANTEGDHSTGTSSTDRDLF